MLSEKTKRSSLIALFVSAACATAASAAVTQYSTRASFNLAAGSTVSEGFETTAVGTFSPPKTFPSGLTAGLASGTVQTAVTDVTSTTYGFVNTTPGGTHVLSFGNNTDTGVYTASFAFPYAVSALGFDLSGLQNTTYGLKLYSGSTVIDTETITDPTQFSVAFQGFTNAAPFTSAQVTISTIPGAADFVAFDEVAFTVPEPGSLALLSVATLFNMRRRAR